MSKDNSWLNYFKNMPDFKFKKIKMDNIENIEELKVDYSKVNIFEAMKEKIKKIEQYPATNYQTIKEVYLRAMELYKDRIFILDKQNPKDEKFIEYTYREFGNDVEALGTALTNKYNLKNERIVIIGENQYDWYVSYISLLIGAGLAVPVDKELPENEIENVINRARATAVIYSPHIKEKIKEVADKVPAVKYFIQMKSDEPLEGRMVGFNTLLKEGKELIKNGDDSFLKIECDSSIRVLYIVFKLVQAFACIFLCKNFIR